MDEPTLTLTPEPLTPRPLPPEPPRTLLVWALSVLHVLLVLGLVLVARVRDGPLDGTPFVLLRFAFDEPGAASIAVGTFLFVGTIVLTHLLHRVGRPTGALLMRGALLGAAFGVLMLPVVLAETGPAFVAFALLHGAPSAAFSGAAVGAALAGMDAALLSGLSRAR